MLEIALAEFILASPGIAGLIVDRIYPVVIEQDSKFPAILYRRAGLKIQHGHGAPCTVKSITIQIDACAETYRDAKTLSDLLRNNLNGFKGNMGGADVQLLRLEDEQDGYESERGAFFYVSQMYTVVTG